MKLSTDPHVLKVTAGLALAGLILFGASFNDPFHFDDILILNDANVTNAERWHHFVNPLHLRQITFFTFYLNYLAGGDSPAGFHIVNVLLHIANAALLFCLVARFTERWIAIAAALVFLVHPIQTESVLYVYQRSILLACFFSLLGTIAVVEKRPWLAALLFLCAFESKESSIAVPLVVAALREARARQREASSDDRRLSAVIDRRYRLALVVGAIILAVAALFLLAYQNEGTVGLGAADEVSPLSYARTQTRVFYTYIRLLFFPYPQSLEYEFPRDTSILPLLGLFVIAGGAWWLLRNEHWRLPALCVFAFFILLAPTSSIVPSVDAAFEHRLYLPMLAFAVFAAVLIGRLPHRSAIGVPLLLVLGVLTIYRGTVWSSDVALWEDAVKNAPGKARAWFNLGGAYMNVDTEKSRAAFLRAIDLQPDFAEAFYNVGLLEQKKNNWAEAVLYFERAIKFKPDYWPAWNNLGNTLFVAGNSERAVECFESTLRLNPDYWPAQYNIAIAHFTTGRFEKAIPRLRTVLDWRPDFHEARRLLASSLTQAGRRVEADVEWKKLGEAAATESRHTPTMILAPTRP